MSETYYFPGTAQPGPEVRRVRYTNSTRLWFERIILPSGAQVWRAAGPAARAVNRDWSWQQLNDVTLVDATGEVRS